MERQFVEENARERKRLQKLVKGLTEKELRMNMPNGWTVADTLAHLAFWDHRSLVLIKIWEKSGIKLSPIGDYNILNDTLHPFLSAIHPEDAAKLAVSSAEAIDRELEMLPDELVSAIQKMEEKARLYRSIHRKTHLDKIEACLGKK